jgi:hypothetical protein
MKKNTLIAIFLLFAPFISLSASTFPEDEAGISAYVKLNSVDSETLTKAYGFMEEQGITVESSETYVLGGVLINMTIDDENAESGKYYLSDIGVYVYLDIDGWLVAYLPKKDPSSKIVQWSDYSPGSINPNVLEEAIELVSSEIDSSYSGYPNYYHFQYPEANKMSIIFDTTYVEGNTLEEENFAVTVPGAIEEASYSVYFSELINNNGTTCYWNLSVNGKTIDEETAETEETVCERLSRFVYDFYPLNDFPSNMPNSVVFKAKIPKGWSMRLGAATALIYQVD